MPDKALREALARHGLAILGVVEPGPDEMPVKVANIALVGPEGRRFWSIAHAAPEFGDGAPDPLDRWSRRVLGNLAARFDATCIFPSDGPPYPPFIAWALRSHRAWQSPSGMLVHERHGLMVSFRGALALGSRLGLAPVRASPCETCPDRPCLSACPVAALSATGYDVPTCREHLSRAPIADCNSQGCRARRACPLSAGADRDPAQSAFHMEAFRR